MNILRIALKPTPEQAQRLLALQKAFAEVCNALAPVVREHHCWNRVTLHHLAYKGLREQFPQVGSQMVCNAIYSVSRTARAVFQHRDSPFLHTRMGGRRLPLLGFSDASPVYFDRHTLSLKDGKLSLFTLTGRMRFQLALSKEDEAAFRDSKLREVVLNRTPDGQFELVFNFIDANADKALNAMPAGGIPNYIRVEATA